MPTISCLTILLLLAFHGVAHAQFVEVHGSVGPLIREEGHSVAVGVGFFPSQYLGVVLNVERTHVASRVSYDHGGTSTFGGATMGLGTAELRVTPFGHRRPGPYGLIGMGAGVARPNEDPRYPDEGTTGTVRALFAGFGLHVPVRRRLRVLVEFRMMLVAEDRGQGMLGAGPLRAGVAWRF